MSWPGLARAQDADVDRARALFNAGARAYDAGDFLTAIDAFEAAEKVAPRAAIVFSLAQANRRQYFLDGNAARLRSAIDSYRKYVDEVPPGQGRRADAAQALSELVPIADKLAPADAMQRPEEAKHTKIDISSPAAGARVSCDGGKPSDAGVPLTLEVAPGKHTCTANAPGFVSAARDVVAVAGEFVPVEIPLVEQPATLDVRGANGASVAIDGRPAGVAGVEARTTSGTHLVAVSRNGHVAFVRELTFAPGQQKTIDVDLASSTQRKIARGALVLGAAGIVAGGVFTAVALVEEGRAKSVLDKSQTQNLGAGDQATYDSARSARTTWTDAAIISFAAGAGIAATGALLYLFDAPDTTTPTAPPDVRSPALSPDKKREPTEIGAAPVVGPGFAGVSFGARF